MTVGGLGGAATPLHPAAHLAPCKEGEAQLQTASGSISPLGLPLQPAAGYKDIQGSQKTASVSAGVTAICLIDALP